MINSFSTQTFELGADIALQDSFGNNLAILKVEEKWRPDKKLEAFKVFGGNPVCHFILSILLVIAFTHILQLRQDHPYVKALQHEIGDIYVSGKMVGIQLPMHADHGALRSTLQFFLLNASWISSVILFSKTQIVFEQRLPLNCEPN
jgi:sulfate adenylyltransferase